MKFRSILILLVLSISFIRTASAENVLIGKNQTRGILNIVKNNKNDTSPLVIIFPGSGAVGPEARFPGFFVKQNGEKRLVTTDGKSCSLSKNLSDALNSVGISTLSVGKPGVDFSSSDVFPAPYYDQKLFESLTWQDWVRTASNAVQFARNLPGVDPAKIYVLGQSESSQMVADYAVTDPTLAGVVLLGVVNENFANADEYQIFDLEVDAFISLSVDSNKDGFIDKTEAAQWPIDFRWNWLDGQSQVSISEIKRLRRNDPKLQQQYKSRRFKFREAIYDRPSTLAKILVPLKTSIYVFNGELDVMTIPAWAIDFEKECKLAKKTNCEVSIVPGLGHAFSKPLEPRSQPFLDWSMGPMDPTFLQQLKNWGQRL